MGGETETFTTSYDPHAALAYARRASRFPVVDDGLYIDSLAGVLVVYGDARMSDAAFDRLHAELTHALSSKPHPLGVLCEVGGARALDARARKRLVELFAAHNESLKNTLAGCAVATMSPVVRGVLHAAFLLARGHVPHHVARSTREGFAWLARRVPGLRANAAEASYIAALRDAKVGPFSDRASA